MLAGIPSDPSVYKCFSVLIALKIFRTLKSTMVTPQEGTGIRSDSLGDFLSVDERHKYSINSSVTGLGPQYCIQ